MDVQVAFTNPEFREFSTKATLVVFHGSLSSLCNIFEFYSTCIFSTHNMILFLLAVIWTTFSVVWERVLFLHAFVSRDLDCLFQNLTSDEPVSCLEDLEEYIKHLLVNS